MNTEKESALFKADAAHARDEKRLSWAMIGVVLVMLSAIIYVGVIIYRVPYETTESLPMNAVPGATAP